MTETKPLGATLAQTGTLLAGRYRLTGRVARGGMADVFAAQDEVLGRVVAAKVFRFDSPVADEQRRIEGEARTLASLRHPGLVMVFDAGLVHEADGEATPFLIMELIAGPTLRQRLVEGPMTADQVAQLGEELASALAYVHGQGIVHRDVKPANILLDTPSNSMASFATKLTDFGIAVVLDATRFTMQGLTVGTANYLSPEQALSGSASGASDVYSLGLVLIEALTGELAFPGVGVEAALSRLHRDPEIPQHLGPEWANLLGAMTRREPDERPEAEAVAGQLRDLRVSGSMVAAVSSGDFATSLLAQPESAETAEDAEAGSASVRALGPRAFGHRAVGLRAIGLKGVRPRSKVLRYGVVVGFVCVLAAALIALGSNHGAQAHQPVPAPTYPTVSGSIGTDLQRLQRAVG